MNPPTVPVLTAAVGVVAMLTAGCAASVAHPAGDAAAVLAALQVVAEDTGAHYDRDDWPHWATVAGECDTREMALRAQGRNVVTGLRCEITAGEWTSPYDGVIVRARSAAGQTVFERAVPTSSGTRWQQTGLDLDHLVPLAEVQRSGRIVDGRRVGPRHWGRADRKRYANDPAVLVAVTAAVNRAKGDKDPARWLPDRDRCGFITRWAETKRRYQLSVDPDEHDAIARVLASCEHEGGPGGRG